MKFNFTGIEKKWQEKWRIKGVYSVDLDNASKPFYNLMMFPYPSAEGLHVGNMYAFTGADVYGRFQRMQGNSVFEPIGLDGFGIHSENYAIKVGRHPKDHAKISEEHFYQQLTQIGNGFAWDNHLETYDPEYYKWTQWLFVQMFNRGLAYKGVASVNWCPSCKTVLADEQVEEGKCERCKTLVERREMSSWYFAITKYADRLLKNIETINWPDKIKIAQRQWIGRSEGLEIDFNIANTDLKLSVWTRFWETIFGVTFIVIAPEHAMLDKLAIPDTHKDEVHDYIKAALNKTEQQRQTEAGEKSGVFTGLYAINPVNGAKVPVWVADYVLKSVGTGAVMGVPAHDERDFAFARKYKLPIRKVVDVLSETHSIVMKESVKVGFEEEIKDNKWYLMDFEGWGYGIVLPQGQEDKYIKITQKYIKEGTWYVHTDGALKAVIFREKVFNSETENDKAKDYARELGVPEAQIDWDNEDNYMFCHEKGGTLVHSQQFDGLSAWGEGKAKMADWMVKESFARSLTTYHLRDWIISRQRYWGAPIPMVNCPKCGWQTVPESELPVILPDIKDFKPHGDGTSPLSNAPKEWRITDCPKCGGKAERELNVCDTFLDSSWYFLAYLHMNNNTWEVGKPFDANRIKKWMPVNVYIGGAEHAVLHLLYSRFVAMVLCDLGLLDFEEPFPFLYSHGLIIKDGSKMSKSKGNVVVPDEYIEKYGADTLRLYLMFLGPYDMGGDFRDTGIEGMNRFVAKLWVLFQTAQPVNWSETEKRSIYVKLHKTIQKATKDIEGFRYNTAISSVMELINTIKEQNIQENKADSASEEWQTILATIAQLIAPFAPHIAEEAWVELFKRDFSVHTSSWPQVNEEFLVEDNSNIVIQVNGKVRGVLTFTKDDALDEEKVTSQAQATPDIVRWFEGKKVKTIFVPGKVLNFILE